MSLALCLKAEICKKGKSIRNMKEGSRGRPWSTPNWAKMAKFTVSHKKSEKEARIAMAFTKNFYIYQKVNELVLPLTWKRGLRGCPWGSPNCKNGKKPKIPFDEKSEKWMRIDWQKHRNQGIDMQGRDVAMIIKDGVRGRPWGPPNGAKMA